MIDIKIRDVNKYVNWNSRCKLIKKPFRCQLTSCIKTTGKLIPQSNTIRLSSSILFHPNYNLDSKRNSYVSNTPVEFRQWHLYLAYLIDMDSCWNKVCPRTSCPKNLMRGPVCKMFRTSAEMAFENVTSYQNLIY